jgi:hypothetical protein
VPLAKRGNIDAELDAYKKRQAADAKAARKEAAAERKQAKAAFAEILTMTDRLNAKAKELGTEQAHIIKILDGWAKWEPKKLLRIYKEWTA